MNYSILDIAQILRSQTTPTECCQISVLLTDSRSLTFPSESLFFALVSKRNDGHSYILDLYEKGVRNFVVSRITQEIQALPHTNLLLVKDTRLALQQLATAHRRKFKTPVVGITGSNGKTIVKEWLYQLLHPSYRIVRSPRSYNSQIGVPLSVWQMNEESNLAIFEAGVSEKGEMDALQPIIRPNIGVLTNIGMAHQEGFSSLQEKCMEKLTLFKEVDALIYDGDNPLIASCVENLCVGTREIAWSRRDKSKPLYISKIEKGCSTTAIHYLYLQYESYITIPFVEDAMVENAIHCLAVMLYLATPREVITERMAQLEAVAMRMEVMEGIHGTLLIDDSYNSDINSLDIALDFLSRRADASGLSRTLILSDIQQTGMTDLFLYRKIATLLEGKKVNRLVGIGEGISKNRALFSSLPSASFYDTTYDFLTSKEIHQLEREAILIKGARSFQFQQISEVLELKQHETILEVNLDAIAHNYHYYKSLLDPATKVVCMVKAFGYGAGSYELAKTLQECGCDYLAVAVADEGVALRKAGITMPIMVMNPEVHSFRSLFRYALEPEVYSFSLLELLTKEADRLGITNYPIHLKIDSGMHRLGFTYGDVPRLQELLGGQPTLLVRSIFSHFAGSDTPELDYFTEQQVARFTQAAESIQAVTPHPIYRHILNTAAIVRFPQHQMEMVRLGIGLYGVDVTGESPNLQTVTTLKTTILQIKEIDPSETIGYGRRGRLERPSRIAAISIGYADGINRQLGCGVGEAVIHGRRAPIVGNICMDVCMVDVTDIPCQEGDKVELFGNQIKVDEIAQKLNTIPYEVLTSVSDRVKRVYFRE